MRRSVGSPKIRAAYKFLLGVATEKRAFSVADLSQASGWKISNTGVNSSKKLAPLLTKTPQGYLCHSIETLTEENFCLLCSQKSVLTYELRKPDLPTKVEGYVAKARESALAAVQHYNNPTVTFRSGSYLMLMVVAFTALLHAVFERDGIDYRILKPDGTPKNTVDNDAILWDLRKSIHVYEGGIETPRAKNIDLIVGLRNKIEHQFMPHLDPDIYGHCQALLLNYEEILIAEFTDFYALKTSLAMALQFSTQRQPEAVEAMRRLQCNEYDSIKTYLDEFKANLDDDTKYSQQFAFRVFLVRKTANHIKSSDLALEFIPIECIPKELDAVIDRQVIAIKQVLCEAQNVDGLKATEVCTQVSEATGRDFNRWHHAKTHSLHKARPASKAANPAQTDHRYCLYNVAFKQYVYKQAWVDFLIAEYSDEEKYLSVFPKKTNTKKTSLLQPQQENVFVAED